MPRRGTDRRLDDDDGVREVLQALRLGDDAELHLQSDGHRLTGRWRGGRRDAGRPGRGGATRSPRPQGAGSYPGPPPPAAGRGRTPPGAAAKASRSSSAREAQLLTDDRRDGLDDERPVPLEADGRRPAGGAGKALHDDGVPGRGGVHPAQLLLEAERAGRLGEQVADPADADGAPGAPGRRTGEPGSRDRLDEPGAAAVGSRRRPVHAPRGPGRPEARVEVGERRRRHERLGQRGDPPDEVAAPAPGRARRRRRRGGAAAGARRAP